jgi:hypothetical protein
MKLELGEIVHAQETALTIRGSRRRTTVPGEIVRYLGLEDGDRVRWILLRDGTLLVVSEGGAGKKAGRGKAAGRRPNKVEK